MEEDPVALAAWRAEAAAAAAVAAAGPVTAAVQVRRLLRRMLTSGPARARTNPPPLEAVAIVASASSSLSPATSYPASADAVEAVGGSVDLNQLSAQAHAAAANPLAGKQAAGCGEWSTAGPYDAIFADLQPTPRCEDSTLIVKFSFFAGPM